MVDRKHFSEIAVSARAALQALRRFRDATLDGKGTPLSDALYFKFECSLGELRRLLAAAGYFKLRRRRFDTEQETIADAALRTLAKDVGESPQAPVVASALVPLTGEAFAARLADVLTALKEFLAKSTAAPQPAPTVTPVTLGEQEAVVLKVLRKHYPCTLTVAQIAEEIKLSGESIGDYLLKLQRHEPPLVTTPVKKSGRKLTGDGLRVVDSLPDAAGARLFRKPR